MNLLKPDHFFHFSIKLLSKKIIRQDLQDLTDQLHQTAPEERSETRIRFAENGKNRIWIIACPVSGGRQHFFNPVNPV